MRKESVEQSSALRGELRAFQSESAVRFEAVETTLRDLMQQLVVLGRAVKVTLDDRHCSVLASTN